MIWKEGCTERWRVWKGRDPLGETRKDPWGGRSWTGSEGCVEGPGLDVGVGQRWEWVCVYLRVGPAWLESRLPWQWAAWQVGPCSVQFGSVAQSCLTLRPQGLQHTRPPCPSPTPRVYPNSCPSSQWCHPIMSSSVVPFSSCPQSLPAEGSFQMSQLFAWGGQSIGASASASFLPVNTQDWFPLGLAGLISLQSKELSRVLFSNTFSNFSPTPQFKSINSLVLSFLYSPTHIHTWPLEKP